MDDLDIATEADTRGEEDAADRRERGYRGACLVRDFIMGRWRPPPRVPLAPTGPQLSLDFGGSDGIR